MLKRPANKSNSIAVLLGVPVILLVLSSVLSTQSKDTISAQPEINPFIKPMPQVLARAFSKTDTISFDSTLTKKPNYYYSAVIENGLERHLILFIKSPIKSELANDFELKIYPKDKTKLQEGQDHYVFSVTNNAVLYNFNQAESGVFKIPLPFVNIKSLHIKQNPLNRRLKPWEITIESPFKDIESDFKPAIKNNGEIQLEPTLYRPLINQILSGENIVFNAPHYEFEGDLPVEKIIGLKNYALAQKRTIVSVKDPISFWNAINKKNKKVITEIEIIGESATEVEQLFNEFAEGDQAFEALFNVSKLAKYFAILNVFTDQCENEPLNLIYNREENKLEPFFNADKCIGESSSYLSKSPIEDLNFLNVYGTELQAYSKLDLKTNFNNNIPLVKEIQWLNSYYPSLIFDLDYLRINQEKIKKSLNQSTIIKAELISINKDRISLSALNASIYPVNITSIFYKKKEILNLEESQILLSGQRDTITFLLPRSFQNLFVSKKNKATGFLLHKHIYDLNIAYETVGSDTKQQSVIIPFQEKEDVQEDLFRKESTLSQRDDVVFNHKTKSLTFSKKSIVINSPFIIPSGYAFNVLAGTSIDIVEGGKIISNGPLNFKGSEPNPIQVFSSDKKGQGFLILAEGLESNLNYVEFKDLTNPKHGGWSVTGAVTFYESPVTLNHVSISNNSCEDALNIVRTNFIMSNCKISNTQSDAFDGDFVTGTIIDSYFENLGNDAIDVSGSDLIITNVNIENAGDKGLSAGEDSKMTVDNVQIYNSAIGVAGKDLSIVNMTNIKIENTKLGFTAFKKKPEFGPSDITVTGLEMNGIEMKYLIESSSNLTIDGEKIETTQNVKDRMYGVEFGRSSEETRNSQ